MTVVVPKVCTLMTMLNIRKIDTKKAVTVAKLNEKEMRKTQMMADTGMNFDPIDEPLVEEMGATGGKKKEAKKESKKKKEVEIDPEELERLRLIELKKKDIEQYGVSFSI